MNVRKCVRRNQYCELCLVLTIVPKKRHNIFCNLLQVGISRSDFKFREFVGTYSANDTIFSSIAEDMYSNMRMFLKVWEYHLKKIKYEFLLGDLSCVKSAGNSNRIKNTKRICSNGTDVLLFQFSSSKHGHHILIHRQQHCVVVIDITHPSQINILKVSAINVIDVCSGENAWWLLRAAGKNARWLSECSQRKCTMTTWQQGQNAGTVKYG